MREIFYVSWHCELLIVIAVPNDAICLINLAHWFFFVGSTPNHVCRLFLVPFHNAVCFPVQSTVYIQSNHLARVIKQIIIEADKKATYCLAGWHSVPITAYYQLLYLVYWLLVADVAFLTYSKLADFRFFRRSTGAFFIAAPTGQMANHIPKFQPELVLVQMGYACGISYSTQYAFYLPATKKQNQQPRWIHNKLISLRTRL